MSVELPPLETSEGVQAYRVKATQLHWHHSKQGDIVSGADFPTNLLSMVERGHLEVIPGMFLPKTTTSVPELLSGREMLQNELKSQEAKAIAFREQAEAAAKETEAVKLALEAASSQAKVESDNVQRELRNQEQTVIDEKMSHKTTQRLLDEAKEQIKLLTLDRDNANAQLEELTAPAK